MVLDRLDTNLPTFHGMALLAVRPELPFVDVGVAVGALISHIGKNRLGMALGAGYRLVHAPQRKAGLVVVELRHSADWLPTNRRMAVLARNVQAAVRAARADVRLRLLSRSGSSDEKHNKRNPTPEWVCRNQNLHLQNRIRLKQFRKNDYEE